ncbi:MAG: hypothetical protein JXQ30_16590 [Spirochaetes bacterium]|nr:hypothetical protein [Spirochaetota bacterium]
MKKVLLLMVLCVGLSRTVFAADKQIEEIYKNIVKSSKVQTPDSYTVKIENKSFEDALKELPKEILEGKGDPKVVVEFKKNEGVRIIIENIKEEYRSLFSMYEEYFKFSGISKVQNPVELREIIDSDKIRVYKSGSEVIVLQAWDPTQEAKDDNFAYFYLDKKRWVISEAVYYLDGNPYVKAQNSYKSFGKYYMPYEIVLTNMNDNTSDTFFFKDYRFNK